SHQRRPRGRLRGGALTLALATLFAGAPVRAGRPQAASVVGLFRVARACSHCWRAAACPALQDVREPPPRVTAMARLLAALYLLGGGLGPVVVGLLSDRVAEAARLAAGAPDMEEAFKAAGLHDALYVIPVALLLTTVFLFQASRCFVADARRMQEGLREESE